MKYFLASALLAATALAAPGPCTPGTYSCTNDNKGWQVCNVSKAWVFAGACPPGTGCVFYPANQSPYCVPPGFKFPQ